MHKRLLLLSNSTNLGEDYLLYARQEIQKFLGASVKKVLFIPFAGVTLTFDAYTEKVGKVFKDIGYEIEAIHLADNDYQVIKQAEAIVIGGGNTFHLAHWLHKTQVIEIIKEIINNGIPYIGWSAGSNIACPTIKTTNDMPIIEPISFNGLNIVPFQINPHYTDAVIPNHNGETREARIREFLVVNPDIYVVGLKEGTMLKVESSSMKLVGNKTMRLFKFGEPIVEYDVNSNLDFLLDSQLAPRP
ncbi:dipeptidase PepE [Chlorogloeopsis sp. ULAP01]|uniref:dipeptidase PepE n=1 Tax=Chlorogloeopsis sp. ULAP01 TaxID=3056483 RepID=UPI0025AAD76F|nr:dipeptidase PepE [Chlorogloeopsis sp. ULAP01]MDM9382293.1 dipeptidase PepE [Chlorogloeopsis sp. ULAP01]